MTPTPPTPASMKEISTTPTGILRLYFTVVLFAAGAALTLHILIGVSSGFGRHFAPYLLVLDAFLLLLGYIGFEISGETSTTRRHPPAALILPLIGIHLVLLCSETGGLSSAFFVLMLLTAVFAGLTFRPQAAVLFATILAAAHVLAIWILPEEGLLVGGWESVSYALRNGRSMSLEEITTLAMHSAFLMMGAFLAMRLARTFRMQVDTLANDAARDPLTQLPNRRGFSDKVCGEMERAQRFAWPISILVIDLDFFKQVNDRYGHAFGDEVLSVTAEILRDTVGPVDHLGRVGGEEFAVAAVAAEPNHGADLAARIVRRFREHNWFQLRPGLKVTCSIGVAVLHPSRMGPNPETNLARLMDEADQALYAVKQSSRDDYQVFEPQGTSNSKVAPLPRKLK